MIRSRTSESSRDSVTRRDKAKHRFKAASRSPSQAASPSTASVIAPPSRFLSKSYMKTPPRQSGEGRPRGGRHPADTTARGAPRRPRPTAAGVFRERRDRRKNAVVAAGDDGGGRKTRAGADGENRQAETPSSRAMAVVFSSRNRDSTASRTRLLWRKNFWPRIR